MSTQNAHDVIYVSTDEKEISLKNLYNCISNIYDYADGIGVLLKHNFQNYCDDDGISRIAMVVIENIKKELDVIYPSIDAG